MVRTFESLLVLVLIVKFAVKYDAIAKPVTDRYDSWAGRVVVDTSC